MTTAAIELAIGLLVAFVLGELAVVKFKTYLENSADLKPRDRKGRVPGYITGRFERTLAFLVVVIGVAPEAVLLAWLAAKLAANWQRPAPEPDVSDAPLTASGSEAVSGDRVYRTRSLIALMAGIVSLGFGIAGGKVASDGIHRGISAGIEFIAENGGGAGVRLKGGSGGGG